MFDIPPTENYPPPPVEIEFLKELVSIGGLTDSGYPHLRLAWGQAGRGPFASLYLMNGEYHLKYRHHVKKTPLLCFPIHGLDGKIVDYDIYEPGDVLPAGICGQLTMREDIGIPRFFMEQALAIEPEEWEHQRQMAVTRGEEDQGPCPEGALVYELMYCLAVHDGCCNKAGLNERGKECRGQYRPPGDLDLRVLRSVENEMRATEGWAGNAGWRNPATARHVAQAVKEHRDRDAKQDIADEHEQRYLIASQLKPHVKRLTGEGSGMDFQKYKFVPSSYEHVRRKKKARKKNATASTA